MDEARVPVVRARWVLHEIKGEFVLAIEAMKMEHRIEAPVAGTVVELGAAAGNQVSPGRMLVRIEADAA